MAQPTSDNSWLRIPDGFLAIPLRETRREGVLRLCVLVRKQADPVDGSFVLLRDWDEATVYLACLLDAAGNVSDWIELWVQNPNNLSGSPSGYRERLINSQLDRRWIENARAFAALCQEDFLATGWEEEHPSPICLDAGSGEPVEAVGADSGNPWSLCADDDRLRAAGLPIYAASNSRYLYQHAEGGSDKFIPVVEGSPENASTVPFDDAVKDGAGLIRLNVHGGFLLARRWSPLDWESHAGVLSGLPWTGAGSDKAPMTPGGPYALLREISEMESSAGHLFSARQGSGARLLESLHLKLQMLADAFHEVREWVARRQCPFLNLSPESFRVRLQTTGNRLPCLWTARVRLAKPSQALVLPLEDTEFRYFLSGKIPRPFVYLPEDLGAAPHGQATVRIREVRPPENGRCVVSGTLVAREPLNISPHDLIWMRVPLAGERVDLYGHLYAEEGLAAGEARFRTIPLSLSEKSRQALQASAGAALNQSSFEIVPLLSTPCDLYSLGVLAVRTLLVNGENTLAVALDEILSLARQANGSGGDAESLRGEVQGLLEGDPRWREALGPHRLRHQGLEVNEAASLVPAELWSQILSWIVRLFPGVNGSAFAKDYGDAPSAALETVFNEPLRDVENLVERSRSLILIEWNQNREIHGIIESLAAQ